MTCSDVITKIGKSVVQHGKYNDRIYLMKLSMEDFPAIIDRLDKLALAEGYSKIFAKVPSFSKEGFVENGYRVEASVPKFFDGRDDAYFMGKYFSESRMVDGRTDEIRKILDAAMSKADDGAIAGLPQGFSINLCDKSDVPEMVGLYKTVFQTYPFPIFDQEYIAKTMDENIVYFNVRNEKSIVALSSSEMDAVSKSVEMTDFATLPEYRGNGLAVCLLKRMEDRMRAIGMKTAYTIARAFSYGINITFSRAGYEFGGTLTNNTNISGNFESMNVWHKPLSRQ